MQFLGPLFSGYQESTGGDKRVTDDWMTCAPCVFGLYYLLTQYATGFSKH
jgi:hypothetical protein